ncbi:MAG: UDP-3-O-(3-hydroxymyristoyl)glucosamine N-acyltransferase [Ginsengibacter sp.]
MQFPSPVSINWIASFINAEVVGETIKDISGINEIHNVSEGDLVFVDHPKYYDKCLNSAASFIIINKKLEAPAGKILFVVDDPFESYQKVVNHFRPFTTSTKMISDSAVIGSGSVIMPNVFIGNNVKVGNDCIIHPNVCVYDNCVIGNNVEIHSGTVIGSDAFYFNTKKNRNVWYNKMTSCGRVVIEDYAEIGANCTIDRGVSSDTIIGQGTKLDNLVHLGHEVVTGKNCLIAAQVGVAGCTVLKDGVTLWGQVGVNKTLTIGENAIVLAQSGVPGDLEGGKTYWGSPTESSLTRRRELIWIKRIPEIWQKLNELTKNK